METIGHIVSEFGIENHGIHNARAVYWNFSTPRLVEEAVRRREGILAEMGPLVVRTGQNTGRSPLDKFIVKEASSEQHIWWGDINRPFDEEKFNLLHEKVCAYFQGKELFVQDCFAGADPRYRLPIRIITETAWHSLFARNLFIPGKPDELRRHEPEFTVIQAPSFIAQPEIDGTRSGVFILVNFARRIVLIGGTSYAGEIKKSIFTVMNYLLPLKGVLSMHCSANVGKRGDTALFFGLSGTGKTTLSADPERTLIGDDEHGWSDHGVFNFEGGCYAKVIRLSAEAEPEIYATTRMFGTVLENVVINPDTRILDLDDATYTENTRGAYPISYIPNASDTGLAGHPENLVMLTCDAFGVLPPIAKLTPEQAMYHFLSGYTAKVAGTEKGLGKEPQATFSTCFGAPFMALHPSVYSKMLGEKIAQHRVNCWLINTGWSGGPFGTGQRIPIAYTRAMVHAALNGELAEVPTREDPYFGLRVPEHVPGVPSEILNPRNTWEDKKAYDRKAMDLVNRFRNNFKAFESHVDESIRAAGPRAV